jgi:hypothetical protein
VVEPYRHWELVLKYMSRGVKFDNGSFNTSRLLPLSVGQSTATISHSSRTAKVSDSHVADHRLCIKSEPLAESSMSLLREAFAGTSRIAHDHIDTD